MKALLSVFYLLEYLLWEWNTEYLNNPPTYPKGNLWSWNTVRAFQILLYMAGSSPEPVSLLSAICFQVEDGSKLCWTGQVRLMHTLQGWDCKRCLWTVSKETLLWQAARRTGILLARQGQSWFFWFLYLTLAWDPRRCQWKIMVAAGSELNLQNWLQIKPCLLGCWELGLGRKSLRWRGCSRLAKLVMQTWAVTLTQPSERISPSWSSSPWFKQGWEYMICLFVECDF